MKIWNPFLASCLIALALTGARVFAGTDADAESYPVNGAMRVRELLTQDGSVYLFRVIFQPYIPGYLSPGMRSVGIVSYTINPFMFLNGQGFNRGHLERDDTYLLIARQRLTDQLTFVTPIGSGRSYREPLTAETRLGDFGVQYEVEVSPERQNVIHAMPIKEFVRATAPVQAIQNRSDHRQLIRLLLGHRLETQADRPWVAPGPEDAAGAADGSR